jgi:hypothetical protein
VARAFAAWLSVVPVLACTRAESRVNVGEAPSAPAHNEVPAAAAEAGAREASVDGDSGARSDHTATVRFRLTALPDGAYDVPRNRIAVVLRRANGTEDSIALGTFSGNCSDGAEHLAQGELARIECWWAGAGDNFVVARRSDALVVSRTEVDSQAPDFQAKVIGRLSVPRAVEVRGEKPELPSK